VGSEIKHQYVVWGTYEESKLHCCLFALFLLFVRFVTAICMAVNNGIKLYDSDGSNKVV